MPRVSIVMPCYNHAEYVADAIRSVLDQTYTDFDFYVFDNGSTDNSWEVMQQFEDERIFKFKLEKNDMLEVKKQFIQKAKGEYFAIMYSDDYWKPEKLEKQMAFMEKNLQIGVSFTWSDYVDENFQLRVKEEGFFYMRNRTQYEWIENMIMTSNRFACPSALFQREFYIKHFGRLYPYRQITDYYCWLKILHETNVHVVEEVLVLQRKHNHGENRNESSATKENILRRKTELRHMIFKVIDEMPDGLFLKSFKKHLVSHDIENHLDVLCEKFFFFLRRAEQYKSEEDSVVQFYNQYFDYAEDGESFYQRLADKYDFSRNDFWEYTGRVNVGLGVDVDMLNSRLARWQLLAKSDFGKLEYPSKLVVYGFGYIGETFYNKIKDYCKVEMFIDKKPKQDEFDGIPVVSLDKVEIKKGTMIVVVPSYDIDKIMKEILEKSGCQEQEIDIVCLEDFLNTGK